jgi:hypothetical protein
MTVDNSGTNPHDTAQSPSMTSSDRAIEGVSDVMAIWRDTRRNILLTLGQGDSANKSSFELPAGLVDHSDRSHDTGFQSGTGERHMGFSLEGRALAPDGYPLDGSVEVLDQDGYVVGGDAVSGTFVASIQPMSSVESGENGEGVSSYDAKFTPVVDGIGFTEQNISYPAGTTISASYGHVVGYVTTMEGDPVADEVVTPESDIATAVTDENGYYTLLAPGGKNINLQGLQNTATKSVIPSEGDSVRADFVYPAVEFNVVGPRSRPAPNVPIYINGNKYETGESGRVTVSPLPLGTYDASIMGAIDREVNLISEGQLDKVNYQGGSRVDINVKDIGSGVPVEDLVAIEGDTGLVTHSGENGILSLVFIGDQDYEVEVGAGSKRYNTEVFRGEIDEGDVEVIEAQLEREIATTNR